MGQGGSVNIDMQRPLTVTVSMSINNVHKDKINKLRHTATCQLFRPKAFLLCSSSAVANT